MELLSELQPSPGFMRLVKEYILTAWRSLRDELCSAVAAAERRIRSLADRLDRLDEAFLFAQSIDPDDERQRNKLRQELALARVERHATTLEDLDVEGILAFAEEVLPSAAKLWTHASLDQRQRLQLRFSRKGFATTAHGSIATAATMPFFSGLAPDAKVNSRVVGAGGIEPPTPRV